MLMGMVNAPATKEIQDIPVTDAPIIEIQTGQEWQVVTAERMTLPPRTHMIVKGKMTSKQGGIANEIAAEVEAAGIK
jgi:D-alanyl-D-alanine carboxypeptidase